MESDTKKFQFKEVNWIVHFPKCGNKGKYLGYKVIIIDRKQGNTQPGKHVKLKEILENPEIAKSYPHTVCYFKKSSGEGAEFKPEYLEIRRIRTVEDFWLFLNSLDM